jgi:manganese-dependent inorganic pyrophosphatase
VDTVDVVGKVSGVETADVLEIIDHHRLADIQTAQPIYVRDEPVGSCNTIIAAMYAEYGILPPPDIAGLMAGAIISDTVQFKSPTCTKKDIAMAERMARISGASLEELGKLLFSFSLDKDAESLFKTDYKEFHISGQNLAVSQILRRSAQVLQRADDFYQLMAR